MDIKIEGESEETEFATVFWRGVEWVVTTVHLVRADEPMIGVRIPWNGTAHWSTGCLEDDDPDLVARLEIAEYRPAKLDRLIRYAEGDTVGYGGLWEPDHYQAIMRVGDDEIPVSGDLWAYFRDCQWESAGPGRLFRVSRAGESIFYVMPQRVMRGPVEADGEE